MRFEISRDCTGEPPGELTMITTRRRGPVGKRLLQQRGDPGDVEPAGPRVGGDDPLQPDRRNHPRRHAQGAA